ncbi:hypothetical protein HTG_00985 [Natrinema mahii]|nr:hypothetical protein HTG_00985 [Natrinema mahii]
MNDSGSHSNKKDHILHMLLSSTSWRTKLISGLVVSYFILLGGYITSSWLFSISTLIIVLVAPGFLCLAHTDYDPALKIILIPVISLLLATLTSFIFPIAEITGLSNSPLHTGLILVALGLPLGVGVSVAVIKDEPPQIPKIPSYSLYALVPILLGALGASIQTYTGSVWQNYLIIVILCAYFVVFYYRTGSDLESIFYIYGIALGILFSRVLVSPYVIGADIQLSTHVIEEMMRTGSWEPWRGGHRSLPSITVVPILLQSISNIPIDYVLKIVYSGLFALTPVGIYILGRMRLDRTDSFAAAGIFIVYLTFFRVVPGKQHISQLFLVTLLIIWCSNEDSTQNNILVLLLASGVILSHYGVSFILIGNLFGSYILAHLLFHRDIGFSFISIFSVSTVGWYLYGAGGGKVAGVVTAILSSIQSVLVSGSQSRTGASVASSSTYLMKQLNLLLFIILLLLIGIGILFILYNLFQRQSVFSLRFDLLSIGFWGLVCVSMFMSGHLGIDRALDISLLVLAPVALFGYRTLLDQAPRNTIQVGKVVPIAFVVILFLFTSGIAYEASPRPASSAVNLHEDPNSIVYSHSDYSAAKWLFENKGQNSMIYADQYSQYIFIRIDGTHLSYMTPLSWKGASWIKQPSGSSYVFIRNSAVSSKSPPGVIQSKVSQSTFSMYESTYSKVYSSNEANVFINSTEHDT